MGARINGIGYARDSDITGKGRGGECGGRGVGGEAVEGVRVVWGWF